MLSDKRLVDARELTFGKSGFLPRTLAKAFMGIFGLNKANRIYAETYDEEDYTANLLETLGISYVIDPRDLVNIPRQGPAIVICNHPTGGMDGIILIDLLTKVRPDVKFMGNFILSRIEPLRKYTIAVDPFDSKARAMNMKGLKESLGHLKRGGLLMIFPAGEVATWQKGFSDIKDRVWDPAVIKFIRHADVPVFPMYIEARNSTLFRLLGKIHPRLRTAMLPRELFNKKGKTVRVIGGTSIGPRKLAALDITAYGNYLRAGVDYLKGSRPDEVPAGNADRGNDILSGIIPRLSVDILESEIAAISEYKLFDYAEYTLYCVPTANIPSLMQEIGRLREITFRQIGEGTMKEVDIDAYDTYYRQLIIWDNSESCLVGGYRMGFGDEIMKDKGLKGFYTDSLFDYADEMGLVLEKTVELGRSFIIKEYQKKPASLMLLWKGIVYVLLKYSQFRNMLGPVTISGDFKDSSKMIISTYLKKYHFNHKLAKYVHPVNGMKGISSTIDLSLIDGISSVELIGKLVLDIEQAERPVPVLVRKYLGLSSTVLGFNVDHDFRDSLDVLMLLDMKHIPEETIMMLSKEITDIDVVGRFKNVIN